VQRAAGMFKWPAALFGRAGWALTKVCSEAEMNVNHDLKQLFSLVCLDAPDQRELRLAFGIRCVERVGTC